MQGTTLVYKNDEMMHLEPLQQRNFFNTHREIVLLSITMISIILIGGCLLNQLLPTDASMGSIFNPLPVYKNGLGAVNGYVIASSDLSKFGTIMVAAEQSGQFQTVSVGLEPDGKYVFQDLKPGKYMIIAFFPDGEYRVMNNIQVESNSVQTLIFKY
jgi:hypothetical protein